jgi:hypothetical protein
MNFSNLIEQMAGMIYFHVDFQLNPKESKVDNLISRIFCPEHQIQLGAVLS